MNRNGEKTGDIKRAGSRPTNNKGEEIKRGVYAKDKKKIYWYNGKGITGSTKL